MNLTNDDLNAIAGLIKKEASHLSTKEDVQNEHLITRQFTLDTVSKNNEVLEEGINQAVKKQFERHFELEEKIAEIKQVLIKAKLM